MSSELSIAWLVPLLPLIGFLINGLFGGATKKAAGPIATALIFGSFAISCYLFQHVLSAPEGAKQTTVYLAPWLYAPADPTLPGHQPLQINFELLIDPLSVLMMLIITGVGGLIHLYSIGYMAADKGYTRFFTYLNLFVFFMLFLVMGNNLLVLFIGWEGVGLCSYLLIGYFYEKKSAGDAAKKAFIMNRIGDVGVLIGMFLLFQYFGTLDFVTGHAGVTGIVAAAASHPAFVSGAAATLICLMLFLGATGKSAQIPLYTWLPDAMEGPTPVSALIHAATMVTAGVYMVSRLHTVFELSDAAMITVCVIGIATAFFAATIGLAQNDIKRVLAYSTVSQLGYMFAACGAGVFAAGMFHVMTHAFFKACLFLGSGSVIHAVEHGMHAKHGQGHDGEEAEHAGHGTEEISPTDGPDPHDPQDMRNMGGLFGKTPITAWTMLFATLAISGIIPFAGFWSKDEILWRLFNVHSDAPNFLAQHANYFAWGLGALTALITAFYMFRMIMKTFFGAPRTDAASHAHESPLVMTLPLIILAALALFTGWDFGPIKILSFEQFQDFLAPSIVTPGYASIFVRPELEKPLGYGVMAVIILVILGCVSLYRASKTNELLSPQTRANRAILSTGWLNWVLLNKYFVDEAYNFWFVKLGKKLSNWLWLTFDVGVVDGIVNGIAGLTGWLGAGLRRTQTGFVRGYAVSMAIGIIAVLLLVLAPFAHGGR